MADEQRKHFIANINGESERLQQLIERLLNLALVEQRQGLEERVHIPLHDFAGELLLARAARIMSADLMIENGIFTDLAACGERFLIA